jgi:hypothetical protein
MHMAYALLIMQSWCLPIRRIEAVSRPSITQMEGKQMTSGDKKPATDKKESPGPDMVNTPGGPVPKEQVHEVKPGEVVRRKKDGTLTSDPKSK